MNRNKNTVTLNLLALNIERPKGFVTAAHVPSNWICPYSTKFELSLL
jgi:hypothetical protein